ncbi:hypothetical protein Emag_004100 [Eimeria magna]
MAQGFHVGGAAFCDQSAATAGERVLQQSYREKATLGRASAAAFLRSAKMALRQSNAAMPATAAAAAATAATAATATLPAAVAAPQQGARLSPLPTTHTTITTTTTTAAAAAAAAPAAAACESSKLTEPLSAVGYSQREGSAPPPAFSVTSTESESGLEDEVLRSGVYKPESGCRLVSSVRRSQTTPSMNLHGWTAAQDEEESLSHRDSIRVQVFQRLQEQREQQEWEAQQALEQQAVSLRQQVACLQKQVRAQQQESLLQQQLLQQREAALHRAAHEAQQLREREQRVRQEREALRLKNQMLQREAEEGQLTARSQRADAAVEWAKRLNSERDAFKQELHAIQRSREVCAEAARKLQEEVILLRQQLRAAAAHTAAAATPQKHEQQQKQQQQQQEEGTAATSTRSHGDASPVSACSDEPLLQTPRCNSSSSSSSSLPLLPLASPRILRMHLSLQQQQLRRQISEAETLPSLAEELQTPLGEPSGCSSPAKQQQQQQQQKQQEQQKQHLFAEGVFHDLEAGGITAIVGSSSSSSTAAATENCCAKQLSAFLRLLTFMWGPLFNCPKRKTPRRDSL